jgi:protease I
MSQSKNNKKIAFLASDGVEESELTRPWDFLKDHGYEPVLISDHDAKIKSEKNGKESSDYKVDKLISESRASDYLALVLPGGEENPRRLMKNKQVLEFVKKIFEEKKLVASICHGPWVLAEAGVLKDRTLTSWPDIQKDLEKAGAEWINEEVVIDSNLITSRKPDDLEVFCNKILEYLEA